MGFASLSARLVGMTAVCLAAALAPVHGTERMLALAAFGLGIALASVMPGYDRWAAWIVGPAVLVLALVPTAGLWSLAALAALLSLGFACFSFAGMERAVPALGLPLFTSAFRSGEVLPPPLMAAWVGAVVVMIVVANRVSPVERGAGLGPTDSGTYGPVSDHALVFGHRRGIQAVAVVGAVVPLALMAAAAVHGHVPVAAGSPALPGRHGGPGLGAHPGLTGGLDTGVPVALSDEVVLRVKAPNPRYWRGTTYDQWDGRRWTSGAGGRTVVWSSDTLALAPDADDGTDPAPGAVTETQEFTVTRAGLDVVVGAWQMTSVRTTARAATVGDDGTVRLSTPLGAGARWTVESRLVPATADELRRADPVRLAVPSPLVEHYGREDDVTPEVAALARRITADAPTTYDKVLALEAWFDANITYSRDIAPLPEGHDAVHQLVFSSRQGYCEQIGSAMVVMLRSLGVPARLVVGYVPGGFDDASGTWVSRASDAHAWAEVWFPGVGWESFDPTAGVPLAPGAAAGTPAGGWSVGRWAGVLVGVGVLVATGGGGALAVRQWSRRWRARPADRTAPELMARQRRFDRCGAMLGRRWTAAMTLREKADDLAVAGIDVEVASAPARSLERAWFLERDLDAGVDGDRGPVDDRDLAALEDAVRSAVAYAGSRVLDRSR